ncbi:SUKH-4 family immunity protein [Streptomyces sp. NPDC002845]
MGRVGAAGASKIGRRRPRHKGHRRGWRHCQWSPLLWSQLKIRHDQARAHTGDTMAGTIITVPEQALPPAITHKPTRHWLTDVGLPGDHDLMRFDRLTESRLIPARDLLDTTDDPTELAPAVAGLIAVGHLLREGSEAQNVVLDGTTGQVFALEIDSPQYARLYPLAPSLEALARLLTPADELDFLKGEFTELADLAGHTGTKPVEEPSAPLTSAFTGEDWAGCDWDPAEDPTEWGDEPPALWHIAALIPPSSPTAGPAPDLRLVLPRRLLKEESAGGGVGAGKTVRFAPTAARARCRTPSTTATRRLHRTPTSPH